MQTPITKTQPLRFADDGPIYVHAKIANDEAIFDFHPFPVGASERQFVDALLQRGQGYFVEAAIQEPTCRIVADGGPVECDLEVPGSLDEQEHRIFRCIPHLEFEAERDRRAVPGVRRIHPLVTLRQTVVKDGPHLQRLADCFLRFPDRQRLRPIAAIVRLRLTNVQLIAAHIKRQDVGVGAPETTDRPDESLAQSVARCE